MPDDLRTLLLLLDSCWTALFVLLLDSVLLGEEFFSKYILYLFSFKSKVFIIICQLQQDTVQYPVQRYNGRFIL